jgi:magnesium transporter
MARSEGAWTTRTASRARRVLPLLPGGRTQRPETPDEPAAPAPFERTRHVDDVIGDCGVYEGGVRRPGRVPLAHAGAVARSTEGFVWIGLQQASAAEIEAVAEEFDLPPLAVEDAVMAHQRPKIELYDDVVFIVLKPVRYVDHEEVVDIAEIALFLGPSFVVTVRHGESDVLRRVRAELDDGDPQLLERGPTGVLYRAADLIVDGYEDALHLITEDVDEIETQVFATTGGEDHSERIYKLKREIAEFRRAVQPLATPLLRLAEGAIPGVDKDAGPYFRDVHDHVLRAAEAIEGLDRLLSDVLQADLSRVAARQAQISVRQNEISVQQNEDMRRISAWAAIALVPTAIAGIYGMNFDNMPELRWKYGYFAVLGVIFAICFGLHRIFRKNGWL